MFELNERVRTITNLSAEVIAIHGNDTYDVRYPAGDEDTKVHWSNLKKWSTRRRRGPQSRGSFFVEIAAVESSKEFFKATEISKDAILPSSERKRSRKPVDKYIVVK